MNRILLIDDDEDEAEILRVAIAEIDHAALVHYVGNCPEALILLKQSIIPVPDLIFLDINMPGMNGLDCLREIKRLDHIKDVPVAMYSNSGAAGHIRESMAGGARVFWKKPNLYLDLVKKLNELIQAVLPAR
jgi:CheY-like chemotaxis protein